MYTWEIEKFLAIKNYVLYGDEYLHVVKTSPQIKRIRHNPYDESFEMWTKEDDGTENYFKYKVRRRYPDQNNNKPKER